MFEGLTVRVLRTPVRIWMEVERRWMVEMIVGVPSCMSLL